MCDFCLYQRTFHRNTEDMTSSLVMVILGCVMLWPIVTEY